MEPRGSWVALRGQPALLNTPGFSGLDFSHFVATVGGGMAVQRAQDKTEQMQARAGALDELLAAFTEIGDSNALLSGL